VLKAGTRNKRAFIAIEDLEKRTQRGIRQGFFEVGDDLNNELSKQMLAKNKRGKVYVKRIRGGARRRHKSSAPGQTPANQTGTMRKARGYQISGSDQLEWGIRSGKGAEHAEFLESGTSKMSARPGLRNTVRATQKNAHNDFSSNIERELTKLP